MNLKVDTRSKQLVGKSWTTELEGRERKNPPGTIHIHNIPRVFGMLLPTYWYFILCCLQL